MEKEIRSYGVQLKREKGKIFGHSSVYNEEITLYWQNRFDAEPGYIYADLDRSFREICWPDCFRMSTKTDPIEALFNRDPNCVLGCTTDKTLSLYSDENGLVVILNPSLDTRHGRDFSRMVLDGKISHLLFTFETIEEQWEKGSRVEEASDQFDLRKILKAKLFDISPVTAAVHENVETAQKLHEEWRKKLAYVPVSIQDLRKKLKSKI